MKTTTSDQIFNIIENVWMAMPELWWPMDEIYAEPTLEYVRGEFADAFKTNREAIGLAVYVKEANDCDNFSVAAYSFMRDCNARTQSLQHITPKTGIAFGLWQYIPDNGGGAAHIINCAIIDGILIHFEPQLPFRKVTLSEQEIASCVGVMI